MLKRKRVREKGKIKFSRWFQKLKEGDKVAVVRELGSDKGRGFPKSLQGRTGRVEEKRGSCVIVRFNIGKSGQGKRFIIHPVHLKKLKD